MTTSLILLGVLLTLGLCFADSGSPAPMPVDTGGDADAGPDVGEPESGSDPDSDYDYGSAAERVSDKGPLDEAMPDDADAGERDATDEGSQESAIDEPPSSINPGLLALAEQRFGISRDVALQFGEEGKLLEAMSAMAAHADAPRDAAQARAMQTAVEAAPDPYPTIDLKELETALKDYPELSGVFGRVSEAVNKSNQRWESRFEETHAVVGELIHRFEQHANTLASAEKLRESEVFDQFVEKLGSEWEPLFGKGNFRTLKRDGKEFASRNAVFGRAKMLEKMYRDHNQPVPPREELYQQALRITQPQKAQNVIKEKITADAKKAASRATRPVQTRRSQPTGIDLAAANIDKARRQMIAGTGGSDDFV